MSKNTIFLVALVLLFSLTYASRQGPVRLTENLQKTQEQHQVLDGENMEGEDVCEGVGEEECLMRRTLVAHVDYIYTQKHKKP